MLISWTLPTYVGEAVCVAPAPNRPAWLGSPPYPTEPFPHEDLPLKLPPLPSTRHPSPCLATCHLPCLLLAPRLNAHCCPLHQFPPLPWTSVEAQPVGGHCMMPAVAARLHLCSAKGLGWGSVLTEKAPWWGKVRGIGLWCPAHLHPLWSPLSWGFPAGCLLPAVQKMSTSESSEVAKDKMVPRQAQRSKPAAHHHWAGSDLWASAAWSGGWDCRGEAGEADELGCPPDKPRTPLPSSSLLTGHSPLLSRLTFSPLVAQWEKLCVQADLPVSVSYLGCTVTGKGMRPQVSRLLTEVQASEGWRESRRRVKSREKTSLSCTQVESRFILEPAHTHSQMLSTNKKNPLNFHSFSCLHAFALSSWLLSIPPPQSGAWMNKSLHLPSPHQLRSPSLYLFPLLNDSLFSSTLISLPPPSVSPLITTSLPHFSCLLSDSVTDPLSSQRRMSGWWSRQTGSRSSLSAFSFQHAVCSTLSLTLS